MRQKLLWMPRGKTARGAVPFDEARPFRVWTLYQHVDEAVPPELPYTPQHLQNAFLEDHVHDWIIRAGSLQYYSRAVNLQHTGVWLLLEWQES
jgi:hypothetical protein